MRRHILLFALLVLVVAPTRAEDRPDLVVADFEGGDYGDWKATGQAFGQAPARGALPGQMAVDGFEGKGLVNSFVGGDDSTGTLTSAPFTIERPNLSFLIGGGKYPGETCVNLLVNGSVVRTATGPNDKPGGSERLEWQSWDVRELLGKSAVIAVVDNRKGGWGHINVDQIVQSDRSKGMESASREITIESRYLHLPVAYQGPIRRVTIASDGKILREFEAKLADGKPDFWVFDDMTDVKGQTLTVATRLPSDSHALSAIKQVDTLPDAHELYKEKDRPQFHFTSRRGWLNDPNGLVWRDGQYHMFYQHNPYGWDWGNMHWGHATSPDLVHWSEHPEALRPRAFGDWAFSGSAVIDDKNTSGFGQNGRPAMVAAFTSTGRGECIVFSNNDGQTWTEYAKNPVVKHAGRDPRLLWHSKSNHWVMAVYDEAEKKQWIAFYSSPDLKTWKYESRIEGFFECPDLYELPVEGEPSKSYWLLSAADGEYLMGEFDGRVFTPESGKKLRLWHGNFYAAQTFSNAPDGRRIQVGWAQGIAFPGMPFNQQMAVPCELSLKSTSDGVRLFAEPVKELASLRRGALGYVRSGLLGPLTATWIPENGADIELTIKPNGDSRVDLLIRGLKLSYDAKAGTLSSGNVRAPVRLKNGELALRILVDRRLVEIFANGGAVVLCFPINTDAPQIGLTIEGGSASFQGYVMGSSWR
jgi:fructan beta-fructosidase